MAVKRLPKTGEFVAQDENGNSVLVIEYTEMIGADTLAGPSEIAGLKQYLTAANETVNALGDGKYQVVGTGMILQRTQ